MSTSKGVARVGAVSLMLIAGLVATPAAHASVTGCKKDLAAAKKASSNAASSPSELVTAAASAVVTAELARALTSCAAVTRDMTSIITKAQGLNAQSIAAGAADRRGQALDKQRAAYLAIQRAEEEVARAAGTVPLPAHARKALRALVHS